MSRLNLLLLLVLIISSLFLIRSAYDARRLFADIHKAEVEAMRLDGEYKRLEAERQAQATSLRVERTAREKLQMRTVTPAVTMYVVDPAAADAAGLVVPMPAPAASAAVYTPTLAASAVAPGGFAAAPRGGEATRERPVVASGASR
jgi:cell division protein FtsL